MQSGSMPSTGRGPGCLFAAMGVVVAAFALAGTCVFLDSGANSGRLELEDADAYGLGTIEYVGERNFFLVRLLDGSFLALSDLDAANRANPQRRCRAALVAASDPALPDLLAQYRSRFSPEVQGANAILRETCFGALFDIMGRRVDADGRNLDRLPTRIDVDGRVEVDVSERTCSERTSSEIASPVACE